ncbi:MAG TPA: MBL fold metallo-hydrolase, partial [Phycisphaerae bacterium]|nr:MBL fold metallo-hydrolase [Phycisphaerae bacterium]
MRIISLQSGSNGNCVYVESLGVRLLFDAGISGKRASERLAGAGEDIRQVDALLISHDHSDHVSGLGIYQRKFGLPVYVSSSTLDTARRKRSLGTLGEIRHFRPGETLSIGHVSIETIHTPHDAADGSAFVVDDGLRRLGIFTDLGHVFEGLVEVISTLDAVLLESNYDAQMLASGPYPAYLKERIRGPHGHISNAESAEVLLAASGANG